MASKRSDKAVKYFKKFPHYNAALHAIAGIGIGILLTHPVADPHPVRWAAVFFSVYVVGYLVTTK